MIEKYYRYGMPAEKKLFEKHKDLYHGIALPAHLVADQIDSLRNFTKKLSKPYFIDPMTHVFAIWEANLISISTGQMRRSYDKLIKEYAPSFNIDFKNHRLSPNMFKKEGSFNKETIATCVKRVLNFQRKAVSELDEDIKKYSLIAQEIGEQIPPELMIKNSPEFLVAPYFFSMGPRDEYYMLDIELTREAVNQREGNEKIMSFIAISPTLLRTISADDILEDFEGCDGIIIWVDGLDEYNSSFQDLIFLKDIVSALKENEMNTMIMYGGIYSGILHKFGLDKYSSGISYGEKRSEEATVGGPIPGRLFIKEFFTNLSQAEAAKFYREKLGEFTCICPACESIRKILKIKKESTLKESFITDFIDEMFSNRENNDEVIGKLERSKKHFMYSLYDILTDFDSLSVEQLVNLLEQKARDIRERFPDYYRKLGKHLVTWAESIK